MQAGRHIVAYFDFDGTLTTRDTLLPFLIFVTGKLRFLCALPRLLPIALAYLCGLKTNEQAKEETLTILLGGYHFDEVDSAAKKFALTRLSKYLKPEVYTKVEWHREHGHTLCLVSANLAIYLRYFANFHNFDHLIATEIEANQQERITGKLLTRNCYGPQKVVRIQEYLLKQNLHFSYSYAYGNSAGDYEMLQFADEPFFVRGDSCKAWEQE